MSTPAVVLPERSSYSQISTMIRCGMQFYLERLIRVPARPNWAMAGGSALHAATEQWDLGLVRDGDAGASEGRVRALFNNAFDDEIALREQQSGFVRNEWRATGRASKEWPNKKDEKWWRANGPAMLRRWTVWRLNSPWEVAELDGETLGIELPITATIGGLEVRMVIDRLFEHAGQYLIVDLKTGDRPPDDGTQLGVYAEGVEQEYSLRPRWGQFWMAKDGGTTPTEDLTEYSSERLGHAFSSVRKMQEAGAFLPHVTSMCSACGVRDYCLAVGGEKAALAPAPWEIAVVAHVDVSSEAVS